jgi:hypothetical protein
MYVIWRELATSMLSRTPLSQTIYHNIVKYLEAFYTLPQKQTNSAALSPQANYTDWATPTSRRNLVPTFVDRGVSRGQRGGSPRGR